MNDKPIVGVAVFIRNNKNEILLGHRLSEWGYNTWGLPGGKLEKMEQLENCAKREVKEECNLEINNLKFIGITNNIIENLNKHYITIYFTTNNYNGIININEKDKCDEWKWFNENNLPNNLFIPLKDYYKKLYKNE